MSDKPDWTTAPESAEVWIEDLRPDFGVDLSGFYYCNGKSWILCGSNMDWSKDAERTGQIKVHHRPQSNDWNGQGLPPVGTVCELAEDTKFLNVQREQLTSVREGSRIAVTGYSVRPDNGAANVVIMAVGNLDAGSCVANPAFVCRPIKSDRDKWIYVAREEFAEFSDTLIGKIYDALKSGKLPAP